MTWIVEERLTCSFLFRDHYKSLGKAGTPRLRFSARQTTGGWSFPDDQGLHDKGQKPTGIAKTNRQDELRD